MNKQYIFILILLILSAVVSAHRNHNPTIDEHTADDKHTVEEHIAIDHIVGHTPGDDHMPEEHAVAVLDDHAQDDEHAVKDHVTQQKESGRYISPKSATIMMFGVIFLLTLLVMLVESRKIETKVIHALNIKDKYVGLLLRISLAIPFIWYGLSEKLLHPEITITMLQAVDLGILATPNIIMITGLLEIAIGVGLLVGFAIRLSAAGAFALLIVVVMLFGLNAITDLVLIAASIVLFIRGDKLLALDGLIKNKKLKRILYIN